MQSQTARQLRTTLTLLLLMTLVSACSSGVVIDSFCLTEKPRRPTAAQVATMSDQQVREALAFNEYGAKRCGWKP